MPSGLERLLECLKWYLSLSYNMGTWDLPDTYDCPAVLGLGDIYQANSPYPCYNYYFVINLTYSNKPYVCICVCILHAHVCTCACTYVHTYVASYTM